MTIAIHARYTNPPRTNAISLQGLGFGRGLWLQVPCSAARAEDDSIELILVMPGLWSLPLGFYRV